jgi:putative protein-disulfide isomerase
MLLPKKMNMKMDWESLFVKYHSLTAKEFSELSGTARSQSEQVLNDLVAKGNLEKLTTKNGSIWRTKSSTQ